MRRLEWEKIKISDEPFEAAGVADFNNNGQLDIISGGYWYEAPDWSKHKICDVKAQGEYYDCFAAYPLDVNGNGLVDFVSCAWFGQSIFWRENPGEPGKEWTTHLIDECGNAETLQAWDVDGDGELEVVPNMPGAPISYYKLIRDDNGKGTGEFEKITINDVNAGHGLGFGDVNGDGRGDFIVADGWWEAPEEADGEWVFHEEFEIPRASIPILVEDVNGDGLAEIIGGNGHGYGIWYWQQQVDDSGSRTWERHDIDPFFSQYHTMVWADIDNDGQSELITGNRYRAHCGHEEGETEVCGLYYFKWHNGRFFKRVIDHGNVPDASGTGLYMTVIDIDGDGWLDVVAPGKEGLYLFKNLGIETVGME